MYYEKVIKVDKELTNALDFSFPFTLNVCGI